MSENKDFHGERIHLRPFEPEDIPRLYAYLNQPELAGRRYIPWGFPEDFPLSQKQVEGIYEKWRQQEKGAAFAVQRVYGQEFIGHAEIDWEWDPHCPYVAVVIDPEHQRQGFATEAIQMLISYLFENTPAHNVSSWIYDWNQAGLSFAKKVGFQESGRSRWEGMRAGKVYAGVLVDLLRPEWLERNAEVSHES